MTAIVLRVICSWCRRVLVEGDPGAPTSHTICPDCTRRFEEGTEAAA